MKIVNDNIICNDGSDKRKGFDLKDGKKVHQVLHDV